MTSTKSQKGGGKRPHTGGRPRQKGERTKKILARLSRMRNLLAMGLSDTEVRERMAEEVKGRDGCRPMTDKQWHHLRAALLQEARGESNLVFWSRFRERHDMRYRECVRLLSYAHGIDNPSRKRDANGRFLDPTDQFLVPPNVSACVQLIRLMKDLDECKLEVGLRLAVFSRESARLLVGCVPEELDDQELASVLDETVRRAAAALGCSEGEVMALVEKAGQGETVDIEATEVQRVLPPASDVEVLEVGGEEVGSEDVSGGERGQ